tara:strand:+ start:483 stop:1064 length:582 start_codon:yes stop_codon:yes gene_type:complete
MRKTLLILTSLTILYSCSNILNINGLEVNKELNKSYRESNESILGIFTNKEYEEIKSSIQKSLNAVIPDGKSIIIHYEQAGENCLLADSDSTSISIVADNGKRISNRMSKSYNAVDFFIYTEDSFFKNIYESKYYYQQDQGFFKNYIFTKQKNCSGFFILKPDGEFMIYYGEDYFTEVENFFNSKLIIKPNEK